MKRRNLSIGEQFAAENARSEHFLGKLNQIKKSNQESKQRTIVNQQKLEWFKIFRNDQKKEQMLQDELNQFILTGLKGEKIITAQEQSIQEQINQYGKEQLVLESPVSSALKRDYFQKDLLQSANAVKLCVTSLQNEMKNLKLNPKKSDQIKQKIQTKREEVGQLLDDVKTTFEEVGKQLRDQYYVINADLQSSKQLVQDLLGFGDEVRGFDADDDSWQLVDPIEHLEIYQQFLGEQEYERVKINYLKTCDTMKQVYKLEIMRNKVSDQLYEEIQMRDLGGLVEKFEYIYDVTAGKGREQLMQRVQLEMPKLTKLDIDALDRYVQNRKYQNQRERNIIREWRQKQQELKSRTVAMIEQQIEETSAKLQHDFDQQQRQRQRDERHAKLDDQRKEYEHKLKIIEEIKREQLLRQQYRDLKNEIDFQKRREESKEIATQFQHSKQDRHKELELIQNAKELEKLKEYRELINKNQSKVDRRQQMELLKIEERIQICVNKQQEAVLREQRLNQVIENLNCRPVVEADFNRVVGETEARQIRKNTTVDEADVVKLFKNDGFTVDKLMKDIRYKIGAALSDAGLAGTTYGKEVLKGLPAYQGVQQRGNTTGIY